MHLEREDVRMIPLAVLGLSIGVAEVFIKPTIVDLGNKALQFLEDKNILVIERGSD